MHKISNFPEIFFVVFVIESWNLISMLSIGRRGLLAIVFAGEEEVVHFAGADETNSRSSCCVFCRSLPSSSGKKSKTAMVKKDKVWDVARDSEIEIDNNNDQLFK